MTRKTPFIRPEILVITFLAILFRAWKVHEAGIIMDEAMTYWGFARSPVDALTTYGNPCNNHVLNSLAIHAAGRLFGFYEHFPRIPSFFCSVVFCFSIAFFIARLIENRVLAATTALAILFNSFTLDLSILARGYAFALAAIYAAMAYLILAHERGTLTRTRIVSSLIVTNFVTLAAMLSTFWILTAMGATVLLLFTTGKGDDRFWIKRVMDGVIILVATFLSLAIFYQGIWREILAAGRGWGVLPFQDILRSIGHETFTSWPIFHAWLFMFLLASLVILYRSAGIQPLPVSSILVLLLGTTAGTWLLLFVYQPLLGLSIGLDRNHVMLVPLMLALTGVLLECAANRLTTKSDRRVAVALGCATLIVIALGNVPSPRVVSITDWKLQSVSGPLVRHLRLENPDRTWNIRLSPSAQYLFWPLLYYMDRGYPIDLSNPDRPDILLRAEEAAVSTDQLVEPLLFQPFGCIAERAGDGSR